MNDTNPKKPLSKQNKVAASLSIYSILSIASSFNTVQAHPQECTGLTAPVTYIESTGVVCLEKIKVTGSSGTQVFKAALRSLAPDKPNLFKLLSAELDNRLPEGTHPIYSTDTGELTLPTVDIPKVFGTERYTANLVYQANNNVFELSTADVYINPTYVANETWKPYGMLSQKERRGVDSLGESIPYAKLANAVYNFDNTLFDAWELIEQEDKDSGMQAGVYQNSETGEIVIAFRGTESCEKILSCSFKEIKESGRDIAADTYLTVGKVHEQFEHAIHYAQDVSSRYKDRKITTTGHSLGGGLAQATGASLGLETFAFNSAPVPEKYFDDYPSELSPQELFDSIFILTDIHDPISNTIEAAGKIYINASHITPLIQFDFNELETFPDRLANLDALRFNKHGMVEFINNATEMLEIYRGGW